MAGAEIMADFMNHHVIKTDRPTAHAVADDIDTQVCVISREKGDTATAPRFNIMWPEHDDQVGAPFIPQGLQAREAGNILPAQGTGHVIAQFKIRIVVAVVEKLDTNDAYPQRNFRVCQ